jgi:serine/threonine protein kinase
MKSQTLGTLALMSPEMINPIESEVGKATDVWSLRVCFYYLYKGKLPFSGKNQKEISNSIFTKYPFTFEKKISQHFQDLIFSMFNKNQHSRITK